MFNFSQKSAFGLDLSDLSLKAIQLEKKNGSLALIDFVNQEIPQGMVEGGEIKKEKELVNLFKKTLGRTGRPFRSGRVVCNLPEEKVFTRIIQLPKMKESELEKAVAWEADAHIPLSADEVYLGWQIIDPIFEHIDHLDIMIVAAPRVLVDSYMSFLKKSGLQPIALEPESIAIIRSLMTKDDLTPSIVVDLGAIGTNFVIFSALAVRFTSHINISGRLFNQSIIEKLKVDEKEANKLKIEVGLDQKKDKKVYNVLEPIIDDLAKEIKSYISFYHEHATHVHGPDGAIGQVVLCGGDSLLNNLPEVLTEKLGLPVKMGNSLVNIKSTISKRESFVYATAIGLALKELL